MSQGQHSSEQSAQPEPEPRTGDVAWQPPKPFVEHDGHGEVLEDECVNWGEEVLILP
jgi:hypothetical protein